VWLIRSALSIKVKEVKHYNIIGCVMVGMLVCGAVDRGFKPGLVKPFVIKLVFDVSPLSFRNKFKDWLDRNQDNVSE
jgi:hypothetical protein